MKFFIDTANLDQIAEAQAMGILDGVTTNPSLMAKEGITGKDNILAHYRKICHLVPGGAISAEVLSTDYASMIAEGRELAALNPQIVVKVPITARWYSRRLRLFWLPKPVLHTYPRSSDVWTISTPTDWSSSGR